MDTSEAGSEYLRQCIPPTAEFSSRGLGNCRNHRSNWACFHRRGGDPARTAWIPTRGHFLNRSRIDLRPSRGDRHLGLRCGSGNRVVQPFMSRRMVASAWSSMRRRGRLLMPSSVLGNSSHGCVSEVARSREMTHAGHELRFHPLSIRKSQFRNWAAFKPTRS